MNRTASRCTVTLLAVATAAAATAIGAPAAAAQQVLVIDTAAGRVIIDDEWRVIRTFGDMALDRTRAILYARDDEEYPVAKIDSLTKSFEGVPTPMDRLWQDADPFFGHLFAVAIPAIPVTDSDQSRWLGSTDPPHPIDELVACGALHQGVGDPIDISETRGFVE